MANDIEKENEKLEKQNRKLKKKNKAGGKIIIVLLLIIAVLAALMFFFDPFGWGIGPNAGKSSGGGAGNSSGEAAGSETSVTTTILIDENAGSARDMAFTDITVSGSAYVFGTEEITIDDFISTINSYDEEIFVNIFDRDATKNAMDALTAALDANGTQFAIDPED